MSAFPPSFVLLLPVPPEISTPNPPSALRSGMSSNHGVACCAQWPSESPQNSAPITAPNATETREKKNSHGNSPHDGRPICSVDAECLPRAADSSPHSQNHKSAGYFR
uniref:(northern house mosquito) hypothetical protein n=1 Tax=Culex pipiens TaxID=7175 RepID=A0A8D8ADH6_CULPI